MKDDREFIKEYRSRKLMLSEVVMKKRFPDILEQIKNYDIANNLTASSFPQMLYNWLYRLKEHPKCPITNQDVLFDKKYTTAARWFLNTKNHNQLSFN